ncbi:hypothetical protein [Paenibacillus sp. CF384]|uniref:hypothetical protein n=1 Tax=Paenibacillus sp. CF384 TaxID=1884382 RepID=UPI00089A8AFC|nr:hypothetical protein [Paenibacillus sp. CF384]SDX20409.1 hypothetical protein SAMN05518855_1010108 [Paenibacillus sp. CF384]
MNLTDTPTSKQSSHLFNVDILVEGDNNAIAMERLLHALNQSGFADFRIKSGIELGRLIEALEAGPASKQKDKEAKAPRNTAKADPVAAPVILPAAPKEAAAVDLTFVTDRIKASIAENRLIRLMVNKGFGVKLNIPCRIINLDESTQMMTVYHVDEKQVYSFKIYEIDEFI